MFVESELIDGAGYVISVFYILCGISILQNMSYTFAKCVYQNKIAIVSYLTAKELFWPPGNINIIFNIY